VLREFPSAVKIFHICEPRISHVLGRLGDMGMDVLYFAADITEVKKAVGAKVCLMGNLSPIDLILPGSPEQIRAEARRCVGIAGEPAGGYLLAPSGAFIPGTPAQNIQALLDTADAAKT